MLTKELEIINLFTSDDKLSNQIIENHNKFIHKIKKYDEFDLEKILIELPYIEKLKKYHLENTEILAINKLNPDLVYMTMCLFFRSVLGKFMTLNNLTQPVIDKVSTLSIDIFPNELPDMLKNGIILQSKKAVLFDNINKILLFNENYGEKECFRIFLSDDNGFGRNVSLSYSSILGKNVDEIDKLELKGRLKNIDATQFRKALYFCLVFSILIKSENTPITVKDTNKSNSIKKIQTNAEKKNVEGWIEKTFYINVKYKSKNQLLKNTPCEDDKVLKSVIVSAHLRRKPHSKDEYIYIDNYTSTRRVIEGNKKITYYLK